VSRVVPSQVVEFIDQHFPEIAQGQVPNYDFIRAPHMAVVVRMVRELPQELMQLSGANYSAFMLGFETLSRAVVLWQANPAAHPIQTVGRSHSLGFIKAAMVACPDEAPSPSTLELSFIPDAALRDSIRADISSANSALRNGEWKAATVLGGAVIEALLLWAIGERAARGIAIPARSHGRPLDRWDLHDFVEAAHQLRIINDAARAQADLAREFRNLIHPGRAERLGLVCDRGTALSAVAAVEHIVRDLA